MHWPRVVSRGFGNWFLGSCRRPHTLSASHRGYVEQRKNFRSSKMAGCLGPLWPLEEFICSFVALTYVFSQLLSSLLLFYFRHQERFPLFRAAHEEKPALCDPNNTHEREFFLSPLGTQQPSSCSRNARVRNKEDCLVCKLALLTMGQFWFSRSFAELSSTDPGKQSRGQAPPGAGKLCARAAVSEGSQTHDGHMVHCDGSDARLGENLGP